MADHSAIEWTDATWQPITGCSIVSPGCTNCYAMKLAGTRLKHIPSREGLTHETKAGPVWTGEVRFNAEWLLQPLNWKRPRRIFVCAHGDLFAENVPDEWIDKVFAVMALSPQHTFQVLTKRAQRMRDYMANCRNRIIKQTLDEDHWDYVSLQAGKNYNSRVKIGEPWIWPLDNVWLGASTERQQEADERIPLLLETPAAVRFVSAEPLLGPIDLSVITVNGCDRVYPLRGMMEHHPRGTLDHPKLDWVIAGGESGLNARPMHLAWVRSLRDQCAAAGVPFFKKQWGEWLPWSQFNDAAIEDDPEQTRFATCEWEDGRWNDVGRPLWCDTVDGNIDDEQCVGRVGKKAAGRLLDGELHNAMPEIAR